jgi:hypothetical protein
MGSSTGKTTSTTLARHYAGAAALCEEVKASDPHAGAVLRPGEPDQQELIRPFIEEARLRLSSM